MIAEGMQRTEWDVNCSGQTVTFRDGRIHDLSIAIQNGQPSRADFLNFHTYQYACQ